MACFVSLRFTIVTKSALGIVKKDLFLLVNALQRKNFELADEVIIIAAAALVVEKSTCYK